MARGHASFYGGDSEEEYRQRSDVSFFVVEEGGRDGGYHRQSFFVAWKQWTLIKLAGGRKRGYCHRNSGGVLESPTGVQKNSKENCKL